MNTTPDVVPGVDVPGVDPLPWTGSLTDFEHVAPLNDSVPPLAPAAGLLFTIDAEQHLRGQRTVWRPRSVRAIRERPRPGARFGNQDQDSYPGPP